MPHMICPVCGARLDSARPWALVRRTPYYRCKRCLFIRMDPMRILSPEDERSRYLKHQNDPTDPGYRAFLENFITKGILPYASADARVLDFGSGPVPALSFLLSERGYRVSAYDSCFAPDRASFQGPFDIIAVHEVAEHVRFPYRVFSRLRRRLAPNGFIAVRTRYAPETSEGFERWWYREDSTHISFFNRRSMAALADRLGMNIAKDDGKEFAVLHLPLREPFLSSTDSVLPH